MDEETKVEEAATEVAAEVTETSPGEAGAVEGGEVPVVEPTELAAPTE